jgi:plasmid stability protein
VGVLTVRNLDNTLIRRLKRRAAEHGRSAEAEHRLILEQALGTSRDEFVALARESRELLKGQDFSDSTKIIRRSRESGWKG